MSNEPEGLMLSVMILLICLTANSALQFECAKLLMITCVSSAANTFPPSDSTSSATPYVENTSLLRSAGKDTVGQLA